MTPSEETPTLYGDDLSRGTRTPYGDDPQHDPDGVLWQVLDEHQGHQRRNENQVGLKIAQSNETFY